MPTLQQVKYFNAGRAPSYIPVAIFLGGTSGIGEAMARALAQHTNGACHIVIIGRNSAAADAIIAALPKSTNPLAIHEFVECDATLMKNVHAVTKQLLTRLPRVNYLVMSLGVVSFGGRKETEEGIDENLALTYYARWAFINDLLPLLQKSKELDEDAKVMSIHGAGEQVVRPIDVDDLGLVKTYGVYHSMAVATTYNDVMVEEFAARNPDIAFTHTFPGSVLTPIFFPSRFPFTLLNPLIYGILWFFTVPAKDCAEFMLYALFEGEKGMYRRGGTGNDVGMLNYQGTPEARKALWDHSEKITRSQCT